MNIINIFPGQWCNVRAKSLFTSAASICLPLSSNRPRRLVSFLSLLLWLPTLIPFTVRAQGALTNGWTNPGTISAAAETDNWTIAANPGDSIAVQIAKLSGGAGFTPKIEIFAPDGASLGIRSGGTAARLDIQANVSGAYTVSISDANRTGTGTYGLQLAQIPGAFTVPPGDEGGSLTNGAIHQGTIDLGDLDMWTLSAGLGDRSTIQIKLRSFQAVPVLRQ